MSDAEVAAEFFRRFKPVSVLIGSYGRRIVAADTTKDGVWYSETSAAGNNRESHESGAPGFVAAVERARELARKGGAV